MSRVQGSYTPLLSSISKGRQRYYGSIFSGRRQYNSKTTLDTGHGLGTDILYRHKSDGSICKANEEDFYSYTTKRWLFDEAMELSRRYVKFDIHELFKIAGNSTGKMDQKCIRAMKFAEGQYNKTFLLQFTNGSEVVAKLPNPNAGPPHYTTASEVATVEFLREVLSIPIPRILSWNSKADNSVGSEFIIMEKAQGVLLGSLWYKLPPTSKNKIIEQVVEMEEKMTSLKFEQHGCIYYNTDIPVELRKTLVLSNQSLPDDLQNKFSIGPLVDRDLWNDSKTQMALLRGPWTSFERMAVDLGTNEMHYISEHGKTQMNYFRNTKTPHDTREALDLIGRYQAVVPHLARLDCDPCDIMQPILWHPDLHLNNIFVDPDTMLITAVIDWQAAFTAPLLFQAQIPRLVRHTGGIPKGWLIPDKPENYETLNDADKLKADKSHESARCQKCYEFYTFKKNPSHFAALGLSEDVDDTVLMLRTQPIHLVSGLWQNRETYKLRASLLSIVDRWEDLETGIEKCPILFTQEEIDEHNTELENLDTVEQLVEQYQDLGILPADGRVDPEDYKYLQEVNAQQRSFYLSQAEDDAQRLILERIWPYQDHKDSL